MPMRVIAGEYRHRRLEYPTDDIKIRPTKDRIREAFFSSVGNVIEGKRFLDLCAGCGSIGIEAASRGASEVYFVDNNAKSISYIEKNIKNLSLKNTLIIKNDALVALKDFSEKKLAFDLIYFDPPYESGLYEEILSYIYNNDILTKNGLIAFETNHSINVTFDGYSSIKEYHYGEISVVVVRK